MKLYRVYFNVKTRVVLAFEWSDLINLRQTAPDALKIATWVFESTPLCDTTTRRSDVINEMTWQPLLDIRDVTTGNFNEAQWIHFGFDFMGVMSMGNLTNPARIQGHLSGMIDHAEKMFMDTSFLSKSNLSVAQRLHEAMWEPATSARMRAEISNLGPVLLSGTKRSKYDFWEAR